MFALRRFGGDMTRRNLAILFAAALTILYSYYANEFEEKLKPFMVKHNLHKRVNLLEHKYRGMQLGYIELEQE